MFKVLFRTLVFSLAFLVATSAVGQHYKLLTSERQLSNSLVNQIFQDYVGYVWIATEDGLNRYDGVNIAVYKSDAKSGLRSNYINKVYEDSQHRLWIGHQTGLALYDRLCDVFEHVTLIDGADTAEARVTGVVEDVDGRIWVSTAGRGLMLFDGKCVSNARAVKGLADVSFISSMLVDENWLWLVAHKSGVFRLDLTTLEARHVSLISGASLPENAVIAANQGNVFVTDAEGGILVYDSAKDEFVDSGFRQNDGGTMLVSAIADVGGQLLAGTDGSGLYAFDAKNKTTERVEYFSPSVEFSRAKIHSIFIDRDGNTWLGLFQKGIMTIAHTSTEIINYGHRPGGLFDIGSGCVMALGHDDEGVWIAVDSDGLYYVDNDGHAQHVDASSATYMSILPDDEGFWLAGYNTGLRYLARRTNKIADCNSALSRAYPRFSKCATALSFDNRGRLWVGTYSNGIFCIDGAKAVSYTSQSELIDYDRNEPVNNWINAICSQGQCLWIGTYRGLCLFDTHIDAFVRIDDKLLEAVGQKIVYDICCTDARLWLATNAGVIAFDIAEHVARHYTERDGLSADMVVSLQSDSLGRIWAGTYHGISCIDIESDKIDTYYANDGLQGNEFSRGAVLLSNDHIAFGGTNGVSRFSPYEIANAAKELTLCTSRFMLSGVEARQTSDEGVTFSAAEKSFAFEFSTFNFVNPESVVYEYSLSGYDDRWHQSSAGVNQVSFTNLPYGHYTLNVRARLGRNTSRIKTIDITITPLWYQTTTAYVTYALIFTLVIIGIIHVVVLRRRMRHELLQHEHERDIDEAKFQFFFNISHEIRTPLTLIINPIRELLSKSDATSDERSSYTLIYRNSMRMLRLINQMLDVRKIEKGQMEMRYTHVSLPQFVDEILHSFDPIAKRKRITTTLTSRLEDEQVDIDVNNFENVIYNVCSNAFKFTPDDGNVDIEIVPAGDRIRIDVRDTGPGLDPSLTEKIFERFYQIRSSQSAQFVGTGIGLHLSRSIVEMHGGSIKAANRDDGRGSVFTIIVPRRHDDAVAEVQTLEHKIDVLDESEKMDENKARPTTGKRILVVDDEVDINNYLTQKLSRKYHVEACTNGRDAYDRLLKESFDMVISDVMMPEMDGLSLCKKIKSNLNISHVPVILLTAKHSDDDRTRGLLTGADAYVAKPFDIDLLQTTVSSIIENRERIMTHMSEVNALPMKRVELKSSDETLMEKVTSYIDEHLSDANLNVEQLASHVGLSRVHMHRKLKELTGQSARDFIKNIRLRQAGILLGEKKLNISEVAYALGFANLSHFSSTFKNFYGVSPKDYMNDHLNENL